MKNRSHYNICVWGDSITWGAWDYEKGGWTNRVHLALDKYQDRPRTVNLGISGNMTPDLLKRFKVEAQAREPDMIVFAIGINDLRSPKEGEEAVISLTDFEKNYQKLIDQAQQFTDQIVLVGLTCYDEKTNPRKSGTWYFNDRIMQYDKKIREIANKNNLVYIYLFDLLRNQDLEDGLHPNSEGHRKIAEKIISSLPLPLSGKREAGREIVL